ncbi:MAG: hypothetical protein ABSE15_01765 [Candidatus Bathyarchaeia archaeon]
MVALTLLTLIALAFSGVNLSNQQKVLPSTTYALPSTASPSPTPEPTPVATTTPLEPTVSFTLWHTNSSVLQTPADQLAHIAPICEIVSPQNQTVLQTNNFTLNVNVASYFWVIDSVYYNTDWIEGIHQIFGIQPHGEPPLNASITVNFSEIPDGNHTVTVYANTHDGSHSFATVVFSTERYQPNLTKPEPFPTLTVAALSGVATVVAASVGLLVYHKRHIRNTWDNQGIS